MKTFILQCNPHESATSISVIIGVVEAESLAQAATLLGLRGKKESETPHVRFDRVAGEQVVMICKSIDLRRTAKTLEAFSMSQIPPEIAVKSPLLYLREATKFVPPPRHSASPKIDPFDSEATGC